MSRSNDTLKQIEEKLDSLQETVENRLDALTNELSLVVRGLSLMSETQGAHSDMLAEVLTACSADPGPNTELSTALDRISAAMETQTETLTAIGDHLSGLGQVIEMSVVRGVERVDQMNRAKATGLVDEDGVIIEDIDY